MFSWYTVVTFAPSKWCIKLLKLANTGVLLLCYILQWGCGNEIEWQVYSYRYKGNLVDFWIFSKAVWFIHQFWRHKRYYLSPRMYFMQQSNYLQFMANTAWSWLWTFDQCLDNHIMSWSAHINRFVVKLTPLYQPIMSRPGQLFQLRDTFGGF